MTDRERKAWGYGFLAIVALSAAVSVDAVAGHGGVWSWACQEWVATR